MNRLSNSEMSRDLTADVFSTKLNTPKYLTTGDTNDNKLNRKPKSTRTY